MSVGHDDHSIHPNGRGLFLMKTVMTWGDFNEPENCVALCKLPSAQPANS